MAKNKKDNPIAVYAVAGQIGLIVIIPLLVFIIGGTWLVEYLEWPSWVNIIFVALGIISMTFGAMNYLKKLIAMYDSNESGTGASEIKHDMRDHDYYDPYTSKKKL
ncbi:MAG: AtpZ/AtpI family protein [Ruminiclostridium sp.]|nr:AtpZ/AtpI family protein [Ruminiclostridium sp.]